MKKVFIFFFVFNCGQVIGPAGTTNGECDETCNGTLPVTDCAILDPERYCSGTATCTESCVANIDSCVEKQYVNESESCDDTCSLCLPNTDLICILGAGNETGVCNITCTENIQKCSNNERQVCNSGGEWVNIETCQGNCVESNNLARCEAGPSSCQNGETQCSGDIRQVCNSGGEWIIVETCQGNCIISNGESQCEETSTNCDLFTTRCSTDSSSVEFCNIDGTWFSTPCGEDAICSVNQDFASCVIPCVDNDSRCSSDNLSIETCSDNNWTPTECTEGKRCDSSAGTVDCLSCTDGETLCSGDDILETCVDGGFVSTYCSQGYACSTDNTDVSSCTEIPRTCDHSNIERDEEIANMDTIYAKKYQIYIKDSAFVGDKELFIEIYPELNGIPKEIEEPITISFSGEGNLERSYKTCAICIIGVRKIPVIGDTYFMPESGSITINPFPQAVGESLSVEFINVGLREVTIDNTTYETTPVEPSFLGQPETWCLTESYSINAEPYLCTNSGVGFCPYGNIAANCNTQNVHDIEDCGNNVCRVNSAEVASCHVPLDTCTKTGHTSETVEAYFDDNAINIQSLTSSASGEFVYINNHNDKGITSAGSSLLLQNKNTDVFTCSTCILSVYENEVSGNKYFMARSGNISIDPIPSSIGGNIGISLSQVELHEIYYPTQEECDQNSTSVSCQHSSRDIPGGDIWCLPSLTFPTMSTGYYPCDFSNIFPSNPNINDKVCYQNKVLKCSSDGIILDEVCPPDEHCEYVDTTNVSCVTE